MKSTPSALFRMLDLIFRWKFTDFSAGSLTEKASHSTAAPLPAAALLFMCNWVFFFFKETLYKPSHKVVFLLYSSSFYA